MNRYEKYATVALLVFALTATIAYAQYSIWSNVSEEVVTDYSLTLDSTSNGRGVTLSGTLTNNGVQIQGATVNIYHCTADGTIIDQITPIAPITTDSNGDWSYWFIEPSVGTYYYIAEYEVT